MSRLDLFLSILISVVYVGGVLPSPAYASPPEPTSSSSRVENGAEIVSPLSEALVPALTPAILPPPPAQFEADLPVHDAEEQRRMQGFREGCQIGMIKVGTQVAMFCAGVGFITTGIVINSTGLLTGGCIIAGVSAPGLILSARNFFSYYRRNAPLSQRIQRANQVAKAPWDETPSLHLKMSENDSKKDTQDEHRCAICFNDFETVGENGRGVRIQCSHPFHEKCIRTWYQKGGACPLCAAVIKKMTPEEERELFLNAELEADQRNLASIRAAISDGTVPVAVSAGSESSSSSSNDEVRIEIHSPLLGDENIE